tara:strand:- start:56 stop:226 length:171 start_codon:yes stop_codon:yes gene_type:complete
MPNYGVGVYLTYYGTVNVEADTPEEAVKQVREIPPADIAISEETACAEYSIQGEEG